MSVNVFSLHLKHITRLQAANFRIPSKAQFVDLLEDEFSFVRLGVGDENSGSDSNFGQNWFQAHVHKALAAMF